MEFPDMGKHCSAEYCNKLDFLPMKCDACGGIFCSEHFSYQTHSCPSAYKKDVQVPICPLCSEPVPTPRDVSPDVTVGAHIDQFCKSEKTKIFTNRCSYKNCKKKELIPVSCTVCKQNFCLRHRHTSDHECHGPVANTSQSSMAAQAAMRRQKQQQKQPAAAPMALRSDAAGAHLEAVQGNMSEDEALARALALSLQDEEDQNARGARSNDPRNSRNSQSGIPVGGNSSKDKCNLS